jgi:hypothetical protein
MNDLHREARAHGGAVYCLFGNHELMNTQGAFDYTSWNDAASAAADSAAPARRVAPPAARRALFTPGSKFCRDMANTRAAVLRVGSTVFVHGSLSRKVMAHFTPDEINDALGQYLRGGLDACSKGERYTYDHALNSNNGILWKRFFNRYGKCVGCPKEVAQQRCCREAAPFRDGRGRGWRGKDGAWYGLSRSGQKVALQRAAYGHTPQDDGKIRIECGGAIILADAGMSGAFHEDQTPNAGRATVVEILQDGAKVRVLASQKGKSFTLGMQETK